MGEISHLKLLSTGGDVRVVNGLSITTENNKNTLKVLDKRYDCVQMIINTHFEELTQLFGLYNNYDTVKTKELCDEIETNLGSVRATKLKQTKPIHINTNSEK